MMDDAKLLNKAGEAKESTAGMEEGKIRDEESRPAVDSDSDSEDEQDSEGGQKGQDDSSGGGGGGDTLTRLRREKRLAMNRESARARRKRKKSHIETLEQQNTGLTRSNDKFRNENQRLVLNVESLTQRLANQEKELLVLRSMTGSRSTNPHQLSLQQSAGTHHMSPPVGSTARGAAMLPHLPATTAHSLGLDTGDTSAQTSLRRLLHAQGIPQPPYGGGLLGGLPQGGGLPAGSGISPNYAVDQQILSRIGAEQQGISGLYDQLLARSMQAQAGNALPGRNSVCAYPCPGTVASRLLFVTHPLSFCVSAVGGSFERIGRPLSLLSISHAFAASSLGRFGELTRGNVE
jgi:hypothetical protein